VRPETEDVVERVRGILVGLPKVVENGGVATGVGALSGTIAINFTVSRRVVARLFVLDPGGRETVALWIRATPDEREALSRSGHPYLRAGPREVNVVLDGDTDWTEVAELVTESYLMMAPKKLAAEVEASLRGPGG
jgi:hypothetical protein